MWRASDDLRPKEWSGAETQLNGFILPTFATGSHHLVGPAGLWQILAAKTGSPLPINKNIAS